MDSRLVWPDIGLLARRRPITLHIAGKAMFHEAIHYLLVLILNAPFSCEPQHCISFFRYSFSAIESLGNPFTTEYYIKFSKLVSF